MEKSADAFRTISEVADDLDLPQHVLRFWETRFPQIRPLKRAGGRRYYRPADLRLLRMIRQLLYDEGYTIKGVQRLLKEHGARNLGPTAVPMPIDLADDDGASVLVEDRGALDDGDPVATPRFSQQTTAYEHAEDALPPSVRAALESLPPISDQTRWPSADRDALRQALATVEECRRILAALDTPRT
jgi:DNA-binding transcriptional MerR regulator